MRGGYSDAQHSDIIAGSKDCMRATAFHTCSRVGGVLLIGVVLANPVQVVDGAWVLASESASLGHGNAEISSTALHCSCSVRSCPSDIPLAQAAARTQAASQGEYGTIVQNRDIPSLSP